MLFSSDCLILGLILGLPLMLSQPRPTLLPRARHSSLLSLPAHDHPAPAGHGHPLLGIRTVLQPNDQRLQLPTGLFRKHLKFNVPHRQAIQWTLHLPSGIFLIRVYSVNGHLLPWDEIGREEVGTRVWLGHWFTQWLCGHLKETAQRDSGKWYQSDAATKKRDPHSWGSEGNGEFEGSQHHPLLLPPPISLRGVAKRIKLQIGYQEKLTLKIHPTSSTTTNDNFLHRSHHLLTPSQQRSPHTQTLSSTEDLASTMYSLCSDWKADSEGRIDWGGTGTWAWWYLLGE